jgi:ABC-type lipoprotein release transport system permease subunit
MQALESSSVMGFPEWSGRITSFSHVLVACPDHWADLSSCPQVNALIAPFGWIYGFGKLPYNRLLGQVPAKWTIGKLQNSLGAARLIASLLFATSSWDPIAYTGMVLSLIVIALLAGYLPARRASRIQPMAALRSH